MLHRPGQLNNYVGITGLTTPEETQALIGMMNEYPDYVLMAGVLVSDKTYAGIPNKYPVRYPAVPQIKHIWQEGAFNVLHYCTADPKLPIVGEVLDKCEVDAGMGMQLNVAWPDVTQVGRIHDAGIATILQMGTAALAHTDGLPARFLDLFAPYYGFVDYVLFDMSGGRGVELDAESLLRYVEPLHTRFPYLRIVAAGGLGAGNLHRVRPLVHDYKDVLSIDAESKLRADDVLQLDRCEGYLKSAAWAFTRDN